MPKIDAAALRKSLNKASISTTISQPDFFLDTGNYALNKRMCNSYTRGLPNKRTLILNGPSATGKSLILGNLAKRAQDSEYFIVYIDTEHAIEKGFLDKIGVSMDDEHFLPIELNTFEDLALAFRQIFDSTTPEDKVFVAVDSLANLDTKDSLETFDKKGELKNDMGLKVKKGKQLLKDVNIKVGNRDMFVCYSNHVYENQDIKNGKGRYVKNGGDAWAYIPSISVMLTRAKLKDDKVASQINGVLIKAEVEKTRFAQPFQKVEIEVPWNTGIDPYSGLLDLLVEDGVLEKNVGWYSYQKDGETIKFQKGTLAEHADTLISMADESSTIEERDVD